ncbi:helix-turn-helix transcriptional regulator [Nocardia huaxiensis]|uniref:helix-turn-helix transcriptional regulator n=1 Tax=Nocardia huaxiensis TaxID=2755382 RepID=UPI001E505142|nr:helix-turn-helix transcriptional regulator [Nocardia huaxiensis]UFS94894.1 helix-turn-helix transcriptional regulator [Nocardia huaxiensis]
MDGTAIELGAFLRAMRERLTPEAAGLPVTGVRRTPGLRRQEVAQLAAVSIDWYIRLEQGRVGTPGAAVLDAISAALRLSDAERAHLHLIARGAQPPRHHPAQELPASTRRILDGMPLLPAYAMDFRHDVLAANAAATAVFGDTFGSGVNTAHLVFLDPETKTGQLDWERIAREEVGALRTELAQHPGDARLLEVIAELRRESQEFATLWNDHAVGERPHGVKRIRHAQAGILTVCYDTLVPPGVTTHSLVILTPADAATETALRTLVTGENATG